jgi:hypothetical protein
MKSGWRTAAKTLTVAAIAGVVAVSCGSPAGRTASNTPLEVIETSGASDRAASMSSESMAYGRRTYVAADDLGVLPTEARAWRFSPAIVDVAQVRALAGAFGIEGEPVAVTDDKGGGWEVGTYPAPLLRVTADAMADWYVNASSSVTSGCVVAESGVIVGYASDDPSAPNVPIASDGVTNCAPLPAAEDLLDTDGALAAAHQLITAAGFDPDDFTMTPAIDSWATTVNATRKVDGLNTDIGWSMTFGSHGALQWASGWLGEPAPAGDYPLVDVATALERLNDGPVALLAGVALLAPEGCGDAMTEGAPERPATSASCPEPAATVVTSVQLSLSSVWTGDGRVWLAPSFRFQTEAGDEATVVAVTDEYFRQIDGAATSDPGPADGSSGSVDGGSVEPAPAPEPPQRGTVAVSPEETQALVELAEDEAAKVAGERGWVLRVIARDGEAFAVTEDYRVDRVNVTIKSGVVVAATVG